MSHFYSGKKRKYEDNMISYYKDYYTSGDSIFFKTTPDEFQKYIRTKIKNKKKD